MAQEKESLLLLAQHLLPLVGCVPICTIVVSVATTSTPTGYDDRSAWILGVTRGTLIF